MYLVYDIFLTFVFIILSPYLFIRSLIEKQGITERLGFLPRATGENLMQKDLIWFHTASVGEVKILPPVIRFLKDKRPDLIVVVSSLTKTGRAEAKRILKDVQLVFHPPIDLSFFVKRTVKKINPKALVLVETEIWPNLIREAKREGAKVFLINGRLSKKSQSVYLRFKKFFSLVLSFIDILCMRTEEDAQRIIRMGAAPDRTFVLGNLKFDQIAFDFSNHKKEKIKESLGIEKDSKLVVAGSIREGEEKAVLVAFSRLKKDFQNLSLIFAPRHMKGLKDTENIMLSLGLSFIRKSRLKDQKEKKDVVLLDTYGELSSLYSCADVAFVGGSLIPKGGHNILEPAVFGVPVLFGPHTENFQSAKKIVLSSGGGIEVKDKDELYLKLFSLLKDDRLREDLGQRVKKAVLSQRGFSEKTVDLILKTLDER
ncbi:MAG: hypothetical protein AMJ90_07560 [candidate division Zixibacteria bacterium SM23_73_2]|nr:MAG: hypothetical protein AMJ90_07560 [candidate division Zixibacteria bacterium SM23_73_2]